MIIYKEKDSISVSENDQLVYYKTGNDELINSINASVLFRDLNKELMEVYSKAFDSESFEIDSVEFEVLYWDNTQVTIKQKGKTNVSTFEFIFKLDKGKLISGTYSFTNQ